MRRTAYLLGLFLFLIGLKVGILYQNQISEAEFQSEQVRIARLRYQDWVTFTSHLAEDRLHPEHTPLVLTHARSLAGPILVPSSQNNIKTTLSPDHGDLMLQKVELRPANKKPGCD